MIRYLLVLVLLLPSFSQGNGAEQDSILTLSRIDSLKNMLQISTSDTASIRLMLKLAGEYLNFSNADAEQIAKQALQKSKEIRSKENMAKCCYQLGGISLNKGNFLQADSFLNAALIYNSRVDNNFINGCIYNTLGSLYSQMDDFDKALENYILCQAMFTDVKNYAAISTIRLNIGLMYYFNKEYEKALQQFSELIGNFQKNNNIIDLIAAYNCISAVYYDKHMPDSAEYFCLQSLKLSEDKGILSDVMESYHLMGKIYSFRSQYEKSNEYLVKALVLADTLQYNLDYANISESLSGNYAKLNEFGKAYKYLSDSKIINDSIDANDSYKRIVKQEIEKQKRISDSRGKLNYIALIGLIISIILIAAVYYNFRIKQKANRLLVEMDELKSKLFSNLTHEFRTPLTLILGPLEEMLSEGERRTLTRHEIKLMRKNAGRLLNLVNQMLDLAKLDAKSMKIDLVEDDFVKFFKMIVSSFSTAAGQKGIRFNWTVPNEPFQAFFDPDKLEKAINNLVSNALKYTDRGGEVNCRLEIQDRKKEKIRFCISDTGKGIKADHLPRIFDRFFQADKPGPDAFSTGIGLSLTKELITLLNGEIDVKSEWGKGSEFTVTLFLGYKHLDKAEYTLSEIHKVGNKVMPWTEVDLQEESFATIPETDQEEKRNLPVVLVAEDQSEIREYMIDHLKNDFRMMQAENGAVALEQAVQHIPDLVITDLVMPEMDGVELCRRLKTDERTSHIPVIMLTALSGMEDKLKGLETGADQYLTKPFHMKELLLLTRKLIEQRNILRERFSRDVRLEPKDIAITAADERFLDRALAVIEKHMGDFDFEISTFQNEMAMSRMQLFRKIKALTDQTPGEFVRTIRLKRAAKLIDKGFGNIAQVCFEVGFNNPSYFAKCFKEMYGSLPSEYAKTSGLKTR